jgi:hypothetical protein
MPQLAVTRAEIDNLLPQLSAAARAAILYQPGPDDGPGVVIFPEEHEAEILAADPADVRPALAAWARDLRWRKEIGGITVAGVPVATDDRSKVMIIGARVAAEANPAWQTVWQGSDGSAYPIDAAAMIAISDAVHEHVNATFAALATVLVAIEAESIMTKEEIEAAFA